MDISADDSPASARLIGPFFEQLPAPHCAGANALYDYWLSVRPSDDLPNRADFGMEAIRELGLLGQFFVLEPINEGIDWRYRLIGTRIVWMFGRDITGVPFSEHFPADEAKTFITLSSQVARTRCPLFLKGRIMYRDRTGDIETLSLPVWSTDRSEVWLVGGSFLSGKAILRSPM